MKHLLLTIGMLITSNTNAQENCGFPLAVLRSGFESGEQQPLVVLPIDGTALSVTITSPNNGEVLGSDRVQVYGNLTGPANVGVLVNGQLALSNATQFSTRPLVLDAGAQVITVTLNTLDGATVSATRNITVTPSLGADVALSAASTGGYAPQTIPFRVDTRLPAAQTTVARLQVDYNGDGTFELDSTSVSAPLSYTFDAPGAYLALARVSFDDGDPITPLVVREGKYRIQLQSLAYARQTLCATYYGMKHRLIANQIPLALNTLGPRIRPRFQTLWAGLGANLATVAGNVGQMAIGRISDVSAEFMVSVPDPAVPGEYLGFPVLFTRGTDGVWRIYGM
jgi:hypothetical protein